VDCAGCSGGHTTCLVAQNRCVACGAGGATGCPSGQVCTSSGNCAPPSATCPTSSGVPTITCNADADCVACDPAHQVCDTSAHKCVACTASNTTQCQTTETCVAAKCSPKCPASCAADADCAACGGAGSPAHACNAHQCAPCSPTKGCTGALSCSPHGTCQATCGVTGQPTGVCSQDSDCSGCATAAKDAGTGTSCNNIPIGGGYGKCGPAAPGCSQLGAGLVLPAPFDQVTQTCSTDQDCSMIATNLNVGAILRDITGFSEIHDATLSYPEHVCASVSIENNMSCGICVPCRVDSDCQPIDIDPIVTQAFGPIGTIAADFLLDQIFGPNSHQIEMYCQTVADGYGVCAPCPGVFTSCGVGDAPGSNGNTCHDECTAGGALGAQCGACAIAVCTGDPFCCTDTWDQTCVNEVPDACQKACDTCSQGTGGHDRCMTGGPLMASCSACVASICQAIPSCCDSNGGMWDAQCVGAIPQYCSPLYLCSGQCKTAAQCTGGDGCLPTYTCGPCTQNYDCSPGTCDMSTGTCQ
jgi:hypothetical protein